MMANIEEITRGNLSNSGVEANATWFSQTGRFDSQLRGGKKSETGLARLIRAWKNNTPGSKLDHLLDLDTVIGSMKATETALSQAVSTSILDSIFASVQDVNHKNILKTAFSGQLFQPIPDVASLFTAAPNGDILNNYVSAWTAGQDEIMAFFCNTLYKLGLEQTQKTRLTTALLTQFGNVVASGRFEHYLFIRDTLCSETFCLQRSLWPKVFANDLELIKAVKATDQVLPTLFQSLDQQTSRLLDYAFGKGFSSLLLQTVRSNNSGDDEEDSVTDLRSGPRKRKSRTRGDAAPPDKRTRSTRIIGGGGGGRSGSVSDDDSVDSTAERADANTPPLTASAATRLLEGARRIILGLSIKFEPITKGGAAVGVPHSIPAEIIYKLSQHDVLLENPSGLVNFDPVQLDATNLITLSETVGPQLLTEADLMKRKIEAFSRASKTQSNKAKQKRKADPDVQVVTSNLAVAEGNKNSKNKKPPKKQQRRFRNSGTQNSKKPKGAAAGGGGGAKGNSSTSTNTTARVPYEVRTHPRVKGKCYLCGSGDHKSNECKKGDKTRCSSCGLGYHLRANNTLCTYKEVACNFVAEKK